MASGAGLVLAETIGGSGRSHRGPVVRQAGRAAATGKVGPRRTTGSELAHGGCCLHPDEHRAERGACIAVGAEPAGDSEAVAGPGDEFQDRACGIVGRLAKPASERATYTWLCNESGLGECLGGSFQRISLMHLYRASDQLIKHRDAIESRVFTKAMSLFGLGVTVALFDLTNTYLAGSGSAQSLAKHGRSKEKRNDRSLITLALVLDGSGFVQCLKIYAGNVAKQETLQKSRKSKNKSKIM